MQNGNSVMALITGFLPYFYIGAPRGFTEDDMDSFKSHLNVSCAVLSIYQRADHSVPLKSSVGSNFVLKVEWVKKRSLWGYRGEDWHPFIKIVVNEARNLPKVRDECTCAILS